MKHSSSHECLHCSEIHRPLLGSVSYTLINILKRLNSNRINCAHSHNSTAYSRVFLPIIPLHYNPCSAGLWFQRLSAPRYTIRSVSQINLQMDCNCGSSMVTSAE